MPMTRQALPVTLQSPEDLTPEVLTSLLRRHQPGVTVTDIRVRSTWQGTTSHLHLDVDYGEPESALPRQLFVKTQLMFYRDLRHDLDVETMTTYFADHLDGPSQFLVIGEDITLRDAQVPDAVAGLSVEKVDELFGDVEPGRRPVLGQSAVAGRR